PSRLRLRASGRAQCDGSSARAHRRAEPPGNAADDLRAGDLSGRQRRRWRVLRPRGRSGAAAAQCLAGTEGRVLGASGDRPAQLLLTREPRSLTWLAMSWAWRDSVTRPAWCSSMTGLDKTRVGRSSVSLACQDECL